MKTKLKAIFLIIFLLLIYFVNAEQQDIMDLQEPQEVKQENLDQNINVHQTNNNNQGIQEHIQKPQIIQNNNAQDPLFQMYESDEKQVQRQERQFQNQQIRQMDQRLYPWVAQQLDNLNERRDFYIGQQFNLPIQKGFEAKVRWNPQKHQIFKMEVFVLGMDANGDIFSPQNPQQYQNVQIQISLDERPFKKLGKVYVNTIFPIDFSRSDTAQIKFINNYQNIVILTVDLQGQQKILEQGIKDDQFTTSRNKMVQMLQQMQQTQIKRQNRYKWQWGFKDKQLKHQEQMLSLTGVELFVIIVTAIVQMYCIKNLLDNRSIV